jgi:aspartate/methionine/tyrosine aminotransferase
MAASSPWSQLHFGVQQCTDLLASPALKVWTATHAGKVIGFAALRPDGIEGEPLLEYVCIDQEYRGNHIGRDLIALIERACAEKRDQNIYLFVSDFNVDAIRLYERLEYSKVGAIPDYNVYGQTEYLYRKVLGKPRQQDRFRQKRPGGLTKRQGARRPPYDLNAGYARMAMTTEMLKAVITASTESFQQTGHDLPVDIDDVLHDSFLKFICQGAPTQKVIDQTFSTFSGSIALDRVFGAVRRRHPKCESLQVPLTVILPEPSLDLWQQLLRDRSSTYSDIEIHCVRDFTSCRDRTSKVIEQLRHVDRSNRKRRGGQRRATDSEVPKRQLMVIIDSPSNPQGFCMDAQELKELAKACKEHDAVLVLDHCFLLAGLHFNPRARLANAFKDLNELSCDWYAIWDTGKSLDLAGDKVAFITASSQELAEKLRESLNVIQPWTFTAFRSLSVLTALFDNKDGMLDDYLVEAAKLCRDNFDFLLRNVDKLKHCCVNEPTAGSFVLLSCDLEVSSEQLADFWQERAKTGVAVGKDFFVARFDESRPAFIRLSLYKPRDMFRTAVETAIIEWPGFLQQLEAGRSGRRRSRRARSAD